jgi:hypothetical protein
VKSYSRSHLSGEALDCSVDAHLARRHDTTAELLADFAEVDERQRYLVLGYPSMYAYCLGKLHSEDSAAKHLQAARAARRFPIIFPALADGRLHLSAVVMLAPCLTNETVDELVAVATHRTKSEIAQLLAERFPRPDVPATVCAIPAAAEHVSAQPIDSSSPQHAPGHVASTGDRPNVTPLAPERFAVQFTIGQRDHELLRYAQELLRHQIPSGNVAEVFVRALRALVPQLEKRKFGATGKPRQRGKAGNAKGRHIPASVRRAVQQRDRGQCTFVGENGHRCESRKLLEFDHVREFARGGEATVENLRLRCRAHNQFTAEQTYCTDLMRGKRERGRREARLSGGGGARTSGARAGPRKGRGGDSVAASAWHSGGGCASRIGALRGDAGRVSGRASQSGAVLFRTEGRRPRARGARVECCACGRGHQRPPRRQIATGAETPTPRSRLSGFGRLGRCGSPRPCRGSRARRSCSGRPGGAVESA